MVLAGHGVASGKGGDVRYPGGTLKAQLPYFKELGLDLAAYFQGTINFDIYPYQYQIKKAKHFFKAVNWSVHIPPENFFFFDVKMWFNNREYQGLIYMPDPETKADHPQKSSVLELILPKIEKLSYGDEAEIEVAEKQMQFYKI